MNCPRCPGSLSELDRDGITIDRCQQCRGIWLDRGELEKLVSRSSERAGPSERSRRQDHDEDDDTRRHPRHGDDDDDDDRRGGRRRSWWEIFD